MLLALLSLGCLLRVAEGHWSDGSCWVLCLRYLWFLEMPLKSGPHRFMAWESFVSGLGGLLLLLLLLDNGTIGLMGRVWQ